MGVFINTNIAAINAQRNLNLTGAKMAKALERLSSGLRINRAADDAAGLAISERMRAQIRGMKQGLRNAQDAVSMVQTAEGALNEVHAILQRMREVTVQAGNSTLSASDRTAIGNELVALRGEIDNMTGRVTFNGLDLFDGTLGTATFQVGPNTGDTVDVTFSQVDTTVLGDPGNELSTITNTSVDTTALADAVRDSIDTAMTQVSTFRAGLGAAQNQVEFAINSIGVAVENLSAAESRIRDADIAEVSTELVTRQILQQAGVAVLAQANVSAQSVLALLQ